ncbi:MAG TPA: hypothetical protein VM734_28575 [Kofleriaceae bacterium]|nr:hypothetical protein [Kofleriaceae bacterium]
MGEPDLKLHGAPDRIFVSVDESTGRSTLSFAPASVGSPITRDADRLGEEALVHARAIAARYLGCAIVGPHFHTAPTRPRRTKRGRR